jgi:peptide/nickel transport system ATP-binding protein
MALLEVEGLKIAAGSGRRSVSIVDTVSFALEPGRTLGIVGESGSGKSTLALSLIRLLPRNVRVAGGRIVFDGGDLSTCTERELRAIRGSQIGFVFQDPMSSLNPTRRVGVQVAEVLLRHRGMTRRDAFRRTEELFESVKIARAKDRVRAYPHELSGGMCQRVTIAMAMACSPKLIIADEPTTALDPTVEAQVLSLLDELKAEHGMAMILISHDLRVVSGVADDVAVMYAGEFVEYGSADAVLKRPEHPYTEALLKSVPRLDDPAARHERLLTIAGALPKPGEWGAVCRFAPRCPRFHADDACATKHPELRELGLRHWARTAHPRRLWAAPNETVSPGGASSL